MLPDHLQKIVNNELSNCIIIADKMNSSKEYKEFVEDMYDYIKMGFEYKELREAKVVFKFHEDSPLVQMQFRHFITNLFFWEPLIKLDGVSDLDESYLVDIPRLSSSYIKEYIDNNIIIPYRTTVSNKQMNVILHDLMYNLARISNDFNMILGMTVNIESFIDMANKNPRFNEIIRTKLDPDMQPAEIEKKLDNLMHEEIDILLSEDNALRPMLRAGAGIKPKQLSEFSISVGLKPDLSGVTIPVPINSNLLVGGLNTVSNYYIDSLGGRKALIMNKTVMGKSGHFARKNMLLASDVHLRDDDKVCDTVHPIEIIVRSKTHLERLVGRYYKTYSSREYKIVQKTDTHLIGQTILVRSPITCSSKHGICKACYGDTLFHINKGGIGIGAFAAAIITNPVSQKILSSKHLLTTTSDQIIFNKHFYKFFNLSANEVTLKNIIENDDSDSTDYSLLIIKDNIVTLTELDEGEINEFITLFSVRDNKTGVIYEIKEKSLKEMYITPELLKLMKSNKQSKMGKYPVYEVNFDDIPDDSRLFLLEVENSELTRPLYAIMGLLDTKDHRNQMGVHTMHDMAQTMLDLLIESKIDVMSVHGEVMLAPLIRSKRNILKRPDFSKYDAESDSDILTVSAALEKHPSVTIGLAFQFLARQLVNPLTFKKRGSSFVDPFFKERP